MVVVKGIEENAAAVVAGSSRANKRSELPKGAALTPNKIKKTSEPV